MNGVPKDLNLSAFAKATLSQIALGEFEIQFHFSPTGSISVEGRWEFLDPKGGLIDCATDNKHRTDFRIHRLLGKRVKSSRVSAPDFFELVFEDDDVLRVFDDNKEFESFSIQPGNVFV
ncbi:MAG: hypothetical protein HY077_15085 [Elusimicrobia bacterium]|nr:hypothetical protein [Elusimicrobiota bacterium]